MALFSRSNVFCAFLVLLVCAPLEAQTGSNPIGCAVPKRPVHIYYVDPINGSMNGDGSAQRPWSTLAAVVSAGLINGQNKASGVVHAGDLIYLLSGDHGSVNLSQYTGSFVNTDFITVQAAPGNTPVLEQLIATGIAKWVFRGLTITNPNGPANASSVFLSRFSACNNILFDRNTIYSQANVNNWTPSDWAALSFRGLAIDANSATVTNNIVKNVLTGIGVSGDGVIFRGNVVDYFADDGIDFQTSNSILQYNVVTNHYGQWNNGGHHDGMQGWTLTSDVYSNVLIDSNFILASTGAYPAIPQPTGLGDDYLQGLSIFDGDWSNLTVTNNVVGACAYDGLSLYGIANSVIENNTVINVGSDPDALTWLKVGAQPGYPVTNVTVRNNIANTFQLDRSGGVVDDHNLTFNNGYDNMWSKVSTNLFVADPTTVFVQYHPATSTFDFNLIKGSPAIGAGTATNAPTLDILKRTRNPLSIDIGAYMYVGN